MKSTYKNKLHLAINLHVVVVGKNSINATYTQLYTHSTQVSKKKVVASYVHKFLYSYLLKIGKNSVGSSL
jgi:hypothetical protein